MEHLGDLAAMLDVEDTEVAGNVDRRATALGAAALLPARLFAGTNHALGAVHQPAVLAVLLSEFLPDLPTASHVPPSQQKRPPLARSEGAGIQYLYRVQAGISLQNRETT
jgi:hypothetical protein